jgi:hypothetical protein
LIQNFGTEHRRFSPGFRHGPAVNGIAFSISDARGEFHAKMRPPQLKKPLRSELDASRALKSPYGPLPAQIFIKILFSGTQFHMEF